MYYLYVQVMYYIILCNSCMNEFLVLVVCSSSMYYFYVQIECTSCMSYLYLLVVGTSCMYYTANKIKFSAAYLVQEMSHSTKF